MIKVMETSREVTAIEQYLMTVSPSMISMKDVEDGTPIVVDCFMTFEDVKPTGESVEILSILTPDRKVYACQSATFKQSIHDIAQIMNGNAFPIVKVSGKTKAGRDYINCILDVDGLM